MTDWRVKAAASNTFFMASIRSGVLVAEAIGLGCVELRRATAYAKERVIFGRPIGQNWRSRSAGGMLDGIEAADLMMRKAAWLYDQGLHWGLAANAAKYLAAEAGFKAR